MQTNDEKFDVMKTTESELGHGLVHRGGRHMKMVKDNGGNWWLCDKTADPKKDLFTQGCWGCDEVIFTRGG